MHRRAKRSTRALPNPSHIMPTMIGLRFHSSSCGPPPREDVRRDIIFPRNIPSCEAHDVLSCPVPNASGQLHSKLRAKISLVINHSPGSHAVCQYQHKCATQRRSEMLNNQPYRFRLPASDMSEPCPDISDRMESKDGTPPCVTRVRAEGDHRVSQNPGAFRLCRRQPVSSEPGREVPLMVLSRTH